MISTLQRFIGRFRDPLYHETSKDDYRIVLCVSREEKAAPELMSQSIDRILRQWDEIFSILESGFEGYGYEDDFPPELFFFDIGRITPGCYKSDESSYLMRFQVDAEPLSDTLKIYDFYFDEDYKIVHHQPVF